jgi:hypothetical protein
LRIKDVKQGHESVDDYIIHFEEYEGFTSFDDAALMESFKEGLTPSILSCCYSLETVLITLVAWKERTISSSSSSSSSSISGVSPSSSSKGITKPNLNHLVKALVD